MFWLKVRIFPSLIILYSPFVTYVLTCLYYSTLPWSRRGNHGASRNRSWLWASEVMLLPCLPVIILNYSRVCRAWFTVYCAIIADVHTGRYNIRSVLIQNLCVYFAAAVHFALHQPGGEQAVRQLFLTWGPWTPWGSADSLQGSVKWWEKSTT
jgi:hypothetical protein